MLAGIVLTSDVAANGLDPGFAGHGVDQHHPVAVLQELPGLDGGEGGVRLPLHQLVAGQRGRGRHRPPVRRALLGKSVNNWGKRLVLYFEWFVQSKGEGGCLKGGACADCNPSVRALLVLRCGVQRARDL